MNLPDNRISLIAFNLLQFAFLGLSLLNYASKLLNIASSPESWQGL